MPGHVSVDPAETDLRPSMLFGPDGDLASALAAFGSGSFERGLAAAEGPPTMDRTAWAGIRLHNPTRADGRPPDRFAMTLSVLMPRAVEVYVVRGNGLTENILNYDRLAPHDPAQHASIRLRTDAFDLAPQETATVMMRLSFGSVESVGAVLRTPQALTDWAISNGAALAVFYAIAVAALLFVAGGFLALNLPVFQAFTGVFAIGLLVNLDGDALLFRFLFPEAPWLRDPVHVTLVHALGTSGLLTAGFAAAPDGAHTRLSRAILAVAALGPPLWIAALIWEGPATRLGGYTLVCAAFVASWLSARVWKEVEGPVHTVAMVLIGAHAAAYCVLLVAVLAGVLPLWLGVDDAIRTLFGGILISSAATLAVHIANTRAEREAEAEGRMAALAAEAARATELLVAERNYARARETAALRQQQLARATHDLKQPLTSLRLSLDAASAGAPAELRERLTRAVDYMEELSEETIRAAAEGGENEGEEVAAPPPEDAETVEPYPLSVVLGTVHRMFEEEAVSKGLTFRIHPSAAEVDVPPLALMRIVSNLAANAIRYTERGRVVIGARRAGGLRLMVMDTGPGMDAEAQRRLRRPSQKGEASEGHGLGLAVCDELAGRHGLGLDLCSQPGRGTVWTLRLAR